MNIKDGVNFLLKSSSHSPLILNKSANSPILKNTKRSLSTKLQKESVVEANLHLDPIRHSNLDSLLVDQLFPRFDYYPKRQLFFSILLNARILITPEEILYRLHCHCTKQKNLYHTEQLVVKCFCPNVVNFLLEWTDTFPYDFLSTNSNSLLKNCLDFCCDLSPDLRVLIMKLTQNLKARISKLNRYEKALMDLGVSSMCPASWPSRNLNGLITKGASPLIVAQQLTHIELERLSMVGAEEIVYALAKDYNLNRVLEKDTPDSTIQQRARNVEHYIEWCNRLRFMVASEICKHLKNKHRAKVLEFFIDVAQECCNMGNFNSLMAIAGGIDHNAVKRLRKTWAKLANKSKWSILEHQTDPSGNFSSYRSTLKAAIWRSAEASSLSGKIVIPAFGILFRDFLALYDHYKPFLQSGQLSVDIFSEFTQHMDLFMQWKDAECPFDRNNDVLLHILTASVYDETTLQFASFECQPPETVAEKQSHKKLRMELQYSYSNDASGDNCHHDA